MKKTDYSSDEAKVRVLEIFRRGDMIFYEEDNKAKVVGSYWGMTRQERSAAPNLWIGHAAVAAGELSMAYHSVAGRGPSLIKALLSPNPERRYFIYRYKGWCYNPFDIISKARVQAIKTVLDAATAFEYGQRIDVDKHWADARLLEEKARLAEEKESLITTVRNRIGDMAQGYQNLSETAKKVGKAPSRMALETSSLQKSKYRRKRHDKYTINDLSWAYDNIPLDFGTYDTWGPVAIGLKGKSQPGKDQWGGDVEERFICSVLASRCILAAGQVFEPKSGIRVTEEPLAERITPASLELALRHDIYWDCVAVISGNKKLNTFTIEEPDDIYASPPKEAATDLLKVLDRIKTPSPPSDISVWDLKTWQSRSYTYVGKRKEQVAEIDRLLPIYHRSKASSALNWNLQCRFLMEISQAIKDHLKKKPGSNRRNAVVQLGWQICNALMVAADNEEKFRQYLKSEEEAFREHKKLEKEIDAWVRETALEREAYYRDSEKKALEKTRKGNKLLM